MSENERKIGPRARALAAWAGAAALVAGAAATSVTQVAAASAISVFVGYADSARAGGEFPNPWNGAPNLVFDGCTPQSACTFDGGAVRVRNDNATSVLVNRVDVHIGACLYTWSGGMYPVTLAAGASLVTTQRASGVGSGCTGPDPSSFDSSDVPNTGICSNDGIQPTVDITVDGVTTGYTDSGQVLNTGGVDPGSCNDSDESTEWVPIGSKACAGQTLTLQPAAQTDPVDSTATVTASFTDTCGDPLAGAAVKFKVPTGPNAGATGSGVTDASGAATFSYSSSVTGTDSVLASVTNAVGFTRTSNSVTVTWIVEFAPGGGSFVIGNRDGAVGTKVDFWGAQWAWRNSLTGGTAPRSFKGFADTPRVPTCGDTWTSDPGNSTPPPAGPLPALMGVIVTSSVRQTGSEISGDVVAIVLVSTDPGYEPNPGHAGMGTVVQVVCGSVASPAAAPQSPPPTVARPRTKPGASAGASVGSNQTVCSVNARGRATTLPAQACARRNRA